MAINIAELASPYLGPRRRDAGENSGQAFLEDHLLPAYLSGDFVTVGLDGIRGPSPSFLEEAFGGLVRQTRQSPEEIEKRLSFNAVENRHLIAWIREYMREAHGAMR